MNGRDAQDFFFRKERLKRNPWNSRHLSLQTMCVPVSQSKNVGFIIYHHYFISVFLLVQV